MFAALGLTPAAKPNSWLGTTELAIGALFARFLYEPSILIENGWVQGGRYSEWLKDLPEECMMAPPYSDSSAATAWRLRWDAPADGGGVVFIDADIAYLDGTDQSFEIPTELQKPECPLHMVVDRLERHLRGTKTSGK